MFTQADRVVAVVAHPDDAELMCYGTLRHCRQLGATVTVLIATHGANGISNADRDRGRRLTPQDRPAECAASYTGTGIEVICLGLDDGDLIPARPLISQIEKELENLGCTILLTHSLHGGTDHQDHLAIAQAATNAATRVTSCAVVLHGEPHAPRSAFRPTVLVEISDMISDKILALRAHRTQAGRWYLGEEYTRHRAADAAWRLAPALAAEGRYFEAFETSLMLITTPGSAVTDRVPAPSRLPRPGR